MLQSIPPSLMPWRCKKPGYQQQWYWSSLWICFIYQHISIIASHGRLTRYVKSLVVHAPGMPERFPRHRLQRKPLVSDLNMHHGTCVAHVPWCISGSLTRGGGENVPSIPGACTTRYFTYLARAHGMYCTCRNRVHTKTWGHVVHFVMFCCTGQMLSLDYSCRLSHLTRGLIVPWEIWLYFHMYEINYTAGGLISWVFQMTSLVFIQYCFR